MALSFALDGEQESARSGRLYSAHGEIETPAFMPVGTLATVKGVAQDVLEQLDAQIILGNAYHLYLRPGHERIRELGGLHRFMSWGRSLLTDSGGFQVFSLSALRQVKEEGVTFRSHLDGAAHFLSPEVAMDIQIALGADVVMCFDECVAYPAEKERVREGMERTLRWAARSKRHFEAYKYRVPWDVEPIAGGDARQRWEEYGPVAQGQTPALFGIVQGGMHRDLRRESALRTVELDFAGYAIGGLSVGEPRAATREMIEATLEHLPADKPRYVMGVGYPEEIVAYAALGVDMMDCVLPTRAARHGLLFTSAGRVNIKNAIYAADQGPADPECGCGVCQRYTRAYLRHLFTAGESLGAALNSAHNLAYYLDTMRAVRDSIRNRELSRLISTRV